MRDRATTTTPDFDLEALRAAHAEGYTRRRGDTEECQTTRNHDGAALRAQLFDTVPRVGQVHDASMPPPVTPQTPPQALRGWTRGVPTQDETRLRHQRPQDSTRRVRPRLLGTNPVPESHAEMANDEGCQTTHNHVDHSMTSTTTKDATTGRGSQGLLIDDWGLEGALGALMEEASEAVHAAKCARQRGDDVGCQTTHDHDGLLHDHDGAVQRSRSLSTTPRVSQFHGRWADPPSIPQELADDRSPQESAGDQPPHLELEMALAELMAEATQAAEERVTAPARDSRRADHDHDDRNDGRHPTIRRTSITTGVDHTTDDDDVDLTTRPGWEVTARGTMVKETRALRTTDVSPGTGGTPDTRDPGAREVIRECGLTQLLGRMIVEPRGGPGWRMRN